MKSRCFQACVVFALLSLLSVNTLNLKRPFAERPNGAPIQSNRVQTSGVFNFYFFLHVCFHQSDRKHINMFFLSRFDTI